MPLTLTIRDQLRRLWSANRGTLVFLLLMLGFRSAWADWVVVPTGSMNPTIIEGDRVLVDKHVYGLRVPFTLQRLTRGSDPRRGDIVVFDSPRDGTSLVKRVVGVPGDRLWLDGDVLVINGERSRYRLAQPQGLAGLLAATRAQQPLALEEKGMAGEHRILILPQRAAMRDFGPVLVPSGAYFMLGDNRDNSADSRYIGFVPRRNIVGRASRVVLSLDPGHHWWPRPSRTLMPLS